MGIKHTELHIEFTNCKKKSVKYSNEIIDVSIKRLVEDGNNLHYISGLIGTFVAPSLKEDIVNNYKFLKKQKKQLKIQNGISPHQKSIFLSYFNDDEEIKINGELHLFDFNDIII